MLFLLGFMMVLYDAWVLVWCFPTPTVSPAKNSLVYFISIVYIDHPVWRSHREEAKRGPPCGHRITRNEGAMVPLLLPCATTGLFSIAAWCGAGVVQPLGVHRGHLPERCRTYATGCACGAGRRFVRVAGPPWDAQCTAHSCATRCPI